MELIKKYWVWILAALLVVSAFIWAPGFRSSDVVVSPASTKVITPASGSPLDLVERLKKVKIDTSFFNDPQFLGLESSPKPSLGGLQKGKTNPFSPSRR